MLTLIFLITILNFLVTLLIVQHVALLGKVVVPEVPPQPPYKPTPSTNMELLRGKRLNANPYQGLEGVGQIIVLVEEQAKRRGK